MDVRIGLWGKLSTEELMFLNCGVGEDSWESLGLQGIQPVHPKGNQHRVFIGRTDAEAETPILWLPDAKNWLTWKGPDAANAWRQEEKGITEDEMVGWHHRLDGQLVMGRKAWHASVHGVTKSQTLLSDWTDWLKESLSSQTKGEEGEKPRKK